MSDQTLCLIKDAFEDEIRTAGGSLQSPCIGAEAMMLRALLPVEAEVGRGDRLRGGVALRCDSSAVAIHPYALRLVCSNGAIFACSAESRTIVLSEVAPHSLDHEVHYATRACCADAAFESAAELMRRASRWKPDGMLQIMHLLLRHPDISSREADAILKLYLREGDLSGFGLMNAVTAVARRARSPEKKWRLEALGGAVPALLLEQGRPGRAEATSRVASPRSRELVTA